MRDRLVVPMNAKKGAEADEGGGIGGDDASWGVGVVGWRRGMTDQVIHIGDIYRGVRWTIRK